MDSREMEIFHNWIFSVMEIFHNWIAVMVVL